MIVQQDRIGHIEEYRQADQVADVCEQVDTKEQSAKSQPSDRQQPPQITTYAFYHTATMSTNSS